MSAEDIDYDTRIDCEVVDYQLAHADASVYNNHVFTIKVWIQKHMYAIERSYTDFCDLDSRLRKQYARSNIPSLKLAGASTGTASASVKLISSASNLRESKRCVHFPPDAEADRNEHKMVKRVDSSEIIPQKKKYLTGYLQALLKIPEVVLSDILLYFLDEESVHGEPVVDTLEEQSDSKEIHLILQGLEMTTKMVRADRQHEVYVPPNHFVVWSFNTLNHDVGFSVTYKDKEILKYQRYDSHHKLIMGHFAMPEAGTVKFIWDNSYSRWRSKTLNYIIKVVCQEEYDAARATAGQQKKDHLLFLKQRGMVRTALIALSTSILSSRGNIIATTAIPAASTPLLSTSTSSPSLSQGTNGPFTFESVSGKAQDMRRTSSSKDVQNNSEPTSGSNSTRINGASANTGSSYWEFADMSEAMREVNRLRNEKKTLQQALGESETALVTERNIAAQYIVQYDTCSAKNMHLENELAELKVEFDSFRENYFNEMESKLAETLATFELQQTTKGITGSQDAGDSSKDFNEKTDADENGHISSTAEGLYNELYPTDNTVSSINSDSSSGVVQNSTLSPEEVSLNQLINFTSIDLQNVDAITLVAYYLKLNTHTQSMLKNGYLTKEVENTLNKLKHEKKQLKTYAIQMKQSLDSLSTRYIHLDQDRADLLNQVRELKDLVILLETDRRGLKEHIAQLCGADITPQISTDTDTTSNMDASSSAVVGDTASTGDTGVSQPSARPASATRPLETPPRQQKATVPVSTPSSRSNQEPDTLNTIGLWLNSGLVSASTAVRSFEGFDFGESKYYYGKHSSEKKGLKEKSIGDLSKIPENVTSNGSSAANIDGSSSTLETSSVPTNTIVISMADLQQAQYTTSVNTSNDKSPSLRNLDDSGSDCGSATDDEVEAGKSTKSGQSKRKSQTGALNALSRESNEGISDPSTIDSDINDSTSNNDSTIHKVTEQLYGILPSWGTLAKVTKF